MNRYQLTATVAGVGKRQHVIQANSTADAWSRFNAAYCGRKLADKTTKQLETLYGARKCPVWVKPQPKGLSK